MIAESKLGARTRALLNIVPYEWTSSVVLATKTSLCRNAHSLSCSLADLAKQGLVESKKASPAKSALTLWRRIKEEEK